MLHVSSGKGPNAVSFAGLARVSKRSVYNNLGDKETLSTEIVLGYTATAEHFADRLVADERHSASASAFRAMRVTRPVCAGAGAGIVSADLVDSATEHLGAVCSKRHLVVFPEKSATASATTKVSHTCDGGGPRIRHGQ
jgi:hypothetical protein